MYEWLLLGGLMLAYKASAEPSALLHLRGEYKAMQPWPASLRTIVVGESVNASDRIVAAEIIVGGTNCSGAFTGTGTMNGNRLVLRPYKPQPSMAKCEVTIMVQENGKNVQITEKSYREYHGAECNFEATLHAK